MKLREQLNQTYATYMREVEMRPKKNVSVTATLTFIVVIYLTLFGISPLIKTLSKKNVQIKEYETLERALRKKITQLNTMESGLNEVEPHLHKLSYAIPENDEMEIFLENIVLTATQAGFLVENFKRTNYGAIKDGVLGIRIVLNGRVENLSKLIDGIEKMGRLTTIKRIGFRVDEYTQSKIEITLATYFMEYK
jgi:Tfp pilus assembly protein PilO